MHSAAPLWVPLVTGSAIAAFAICFYLLLFFLVRRGLKPGTLGHCLAKHLSLPIFIVFLECAAMIAWHLLELPTSYEWIIRHILSIILIATAAWVLIATLRAIYHYMVGKHNNATITDFSKRSSLTQAHLLYQSSLFATILLAVAFILMTFPQIRSIGLGILGSAGIAGIALGIAARPILLNLMAGIQIAFTKTIKLEDALIVNGEYALVEAIRLTHVTLRTWDLRRLIYPISYFIDNPFQNWSTSSTELIGTVYLDCDYTLPVDVMREKFEALVKSSPLWNGKVATLSVHDASAQTLKLRMIMTANNASETYNLRCYVREKMIDFIQREYPKALPCVRYENYN